MAQIPKNLKDGYRQALRPSDTDGQWRVAVDLEGATISVPGGIEVQLKHDGANPDSVRVGDGTDILSVNADGSINVNVVSSQDTTATIFNVSAATAGTEYSQALPANCKKFILRSRNRSEVQLAYTSGQTGTNYLTLRPGATYEDVNFYIAQTIYFQASKNAETIEIIAFT